MTPVKSQISNEQWSPSAISRFTNLSGFLEFAQELMQLVAVIPAQP
jgi:hypothetical protein